jgi:hypothetical protein
MHANGGLPARPRLRPEHLPRGGPHGERCATGLDCVPSSGGASVCDLVSYGVMTGAKTCSGECSEAAHCCGFPSGLGVTVLTDAGGSVTAQNCEDILVEGLGGDAAACDGPPPSGTNLATVCFYYRTYCSCAADTWACNAGKCLYTASCQSNSVNTLGGCPLFTRARSALNSTCDMASNKCRAASSLCAADADCEGLRVVDLSGITVAGATALATPARAI